MSSPQYSVLFSAPVSGTGPSSGSVADVLIPDATTGLYVKATTANRGTRRSTGIALSAYTAGGVVDVQQFGQVDVTTAGLGAGAASWVRVSTTGTLERVTPSGSDDVVGWVEADGTFRACFGFLTAAVVNGGSAFVPPTGTGFATVTASVLDAASLAFPLSAAKGGTGLAALGANVATFLGTPSGANLASALTSALPVAKGGTGLTALTIPASALLVGTTDAQTLTTKTMTGTVSIAFGAVPAASGSVRLENNAFVKGVTTGAADVSLIGVDNSNYVTIGSVLQSLVGGDDIILALGFSGQVMRITTNIGVALPITGLSQPFAGMNGLFSKTLTAAQSYDLAASEYANSTFKIVSNGANVLRFPPASDAGSYWKFVWNISGGGTISVRDTNAVSAAATLASGNGALFLFANGIVKQMSAAFAVA